MCVGATSLKSVNVWIELSVSESACTYSGTRACFISFCFSLGFSMLRGANHHKLAKKECRLYARHELFCTFVLCYKKFESREETRQFETYENLQRFFFCCSLPRSIYLHISLYHTQIGEYIYSCSNSMELIYL